MWMNVVGMECGGVWQGGSAFGRGSVRNQAMASRSPTNDLGELTASTTSLQSTEDEMGEKNVEHCSG